MELTNQQLAVLFDKINQHLVYAKAGGTENYTDKIVYNAMQIFSSIEQISSDASIFWDKLLNDFTFETLKVLGAEEIITLMQKTKNRGILEISEVKGLFKGGKIKKIIQECSNQFLTDLNNIGGVDYITDNYFAPFILNKYSNIIDFGF